MEIDARDAEAIAHDEKGVPHFVEQDEQHEPEPRSGREAKSRENQSAEGRQHVHPQGDASPPADRQISAVHHSRNIGSRARAARAWAHRTAASGAPRAVSLVQHMYHDVTIVASVARAW